MAHLIVRLPEEEQDLLEASERSSEATERSTNSITSDDDFLLENGTGPGDMTMASSRTRCFGCRNCKQSSLYLATAASSYYNHLYPPPDFSKRDNTTGVVDLDPSLAGLHTYLGGNEGYKHLVNTK